MRHTEIAAVGPYPSRAGRTVVQPGRIGVRAEFAAGVTKLDPDYDKSCGSKIFASARESDVGGATDRHASTVQVHHRGQYAGLVGAADVERDVVAVLARDGGGRGGDTCDVRYGLPERAEDGADALLVHRDKGEALLQRRIDRQRRFREDSVESEFRERLDHSRIRSRVGAECAIG